MFVQTSIWERIREQFSEEERDALREAMTGETICPPGACLDDYKLAPALAEKLTAALRALTPVARR